MSGVCEVSLMSQIYRETQISKLVLFECIGVACVLS